jgi:hypothetical protein
MLVLWLKKEMTQFKDVILNDKGFESFDRSVDVSLAEEYALEMYVMIVYEC